MGTNEQRAPVAEDRGRSRWGRRWLVLCDSCCASKAVRLSLLWLCLVLWPSGRPLGVPVCSAAGYRVLKEWKQPAAITSVVFSPNGKMLALAREDGAVAIYDLTMTRDGTIVTTGKDVENLQFSPSSSQLMVVQTHELRFLESGDDARWQIARTIDLPDGDTFAIANAAYMADDDSLVLCQARLLYGRVGRCDTDLRQITWLREFDRMCGRVSVSSQRNRLCLTTLGPWVVMSTTTGAIHFSRKGSIGSSQVSPNGEIGAVGYYDSPVMPRSRATIIVFDVNTGKSVARLSGNYSVESPSSLSFSSDSKVLAFISKGRVVNLFIIHQDAFLEPLVHEGEVSSVCFSPVLRWVVTAQSDGRVILWSNEKIVDVEEHLQREKKPQDECTQVN